VALKHINEQIVAPIQKNPALSESINKIILKATSKNKRERYRSMDALCADLTRSLVNSSGDFVDLHLPYISNQVNRIHASRKFKIWKICVLAVLIVGVVIAAFFSAEAIHMAALETMDVPDVTGISVDIAAAQLESLSLLSNTVFEASETIPMGVVISQTPTPGSSAAKGDTVTLTISSGPSDVLMPDLYGVMLDDARTLIGQMGLELESVTYDAVEGTTTGSVIAQSPEADSVVVTGDPVSLIVSGESTPSGAVPQLTGLMLGQAAARLYDTGFTKCYVYEQESELPEGTVAAQSPEQGIQTPFSNEVTLWVSAFQDKKYSGMLIAQIDIAEKESTVRTFVEDSVDGQIVSFVQERQPDIGILALDYRVYCMTGGVKTVRVFVNGVETYTGEIEVE
jgi:serine/threonine-protein kinase